MTMHGLPQGVTNPPKPLTAVDAEGGIQESEAKPTGTIVLVFVFLAAFVLYYFVNWKLLSVVWKIG